MHIRHEDDVEPERHISTDDDDEQGPGKVVLATPQPPPCVYYRLYSQTMRLCYTHQPTSPPESPGDGKGWAAPGVFVTYNHLLHEAGACLPLGAGETCRLRCHRSTLCSIQLSACHHLIVIRHMEQYAVHLWC